MRKISLMSGMMFAAFILMAGAALGAAQLTLSSNMACDQLTIGGTAISTFAVGDRTLDEGTGGIAIAANGTLTSGAGTIQCAGNWSNLGTFTAGTGTVVLDGTGQSITGSTTFRNLTKTPSAACTLSFADGSTTTVSGTLTLQGQSGKLLSLRSSSDGTRWNIDPQGTRSIQYVDVKDSYNINSALINPGTGSTNSLNNINWDFGGVPTVTTNAASEVGAITATFNGTVNANGNETTVKFEYGTTIAYGSEVIADESPVTGSTATAVSKTITGLTAETTYHYRAVGSNSGGTIEGADQTFTTRSATAETKADGDWSTVGTWVGNVVPSSDQSVTIKHAVTLNTANPTVQGLTIDAGKSLDIGANTLTAEGASDINGTLTIGAGTYNSEGAFDAGDGNVTFSDVGKLNLSSTVTSLGTFTKGTGTITYDGAAQDVASVDYYNLTFDGSDNKTLAGNIGIAKTFTITAGTFVHNNKTVTYNGGDQTIPALAYYGLGVSGTGTRKVFEDGDISVATEIVLGDTMTLTGSSADAVTVKVNTPGEGGTQSRVFHINAAGKTVTISNMSIQGGDITNSTTFPDAEDRRGGCIYVANGTLDLQASALSMGYAQTGGGIYGANGTDIIVTESSISGNTAETANGGGIDIRQDSNPTTLTIAQSTVSGNTCGNEGGGIYASRCSSVTLTDVTISGNKTGVNGGGAYFYGGTVSLTNSIFAYDYRTDNTYSDIYNDGATIYGNYNIAGDWDAGWGGTGNTAYTYPNQGKGDALFASYTEILANTIYKPDLEDNGGATQTVRLAGNSTAAETGVKTGTYDGGGTTKYAFWDGSKWVEVENGITEATGVTEISTDQRGADRHADPCIGAYELYAHYTTNGSGTAWSTAANWNMYNGVTTPVATTSPNSDNSTAITVNHDMNVNADVTVDQTTVNSGKTLTVDTAKTMTVADGDGTDLTVTGTVVKNGIVTCEADSTVSFNGVDQDLPSGVTFQNLDIDGGGTKTLSGDSTVNKTLTFTNGLVSLGDHDLTLGNTATVAGTLDASSMIVTGGTGVLKKVFSATGLFTFPVGDNTGTAEYSPATLNFTGGTFNSAWAGVKVINAKQPDNTSTTDYLNRYWTVTQSGVSGFSCATTFNYLEADVVGTEADVYGAQWDGSTWMAFEPVNPSNHTFEATVSSFSDFTGVVGPTSAPTATAATSITQTGFTANWNTATGATKYYLDVSTKSDFSSYVSGYENKDVGNVTTVGVTGLTAGTAYYYRVRAYNPGGTSGSSNIITVTTVPPAPVATVATSFTQTGFTANWNTATGATKYYLDVSTKSDFSSYVSGYENKDVGNVTTVGVTGLSAGTAYYYRVRAYNASGVSDNSNVISTATGELPTKVTLTGPGTVNANTVSSVFTLTSRDKNNDPANVNQDTTFNLTSNSTETATFFSDVTGKLPITRTTISNGNQTATFYYRDTAAGTPTVTATRTSGMALGAATHQVTVQAGTVSGTVFEDLNGNGIQDTGEPGINNATVTLINSGGSTVQTTTTTEIGTYSFADVSPGTYTVQETDPSGYISTTSNRVAVSVSDGGAASANFGDLSQGYVTGTVFDDLNGNGIQDGGEPGIGNVTVKRLDSGGSELESTTTHGDDGSYSFNNVPSGNYKIRETDPSGYTSTSSNTVTVTVPPGGSATANFGDRGEGTVSGTVYVDANGNGIQNADEPGISGVTVTLLDENGGTIESTTTGADGTYSFTGVTAGSYTVEETDPSGYASTTSNSVLVSVATGGSASASFGDQEQGTVSGRVFNDQNGSGRQEALEPSLSGVTIQLLNDAQTPVQTGKTDGDGSYRFDGVTAGNYTVQETDPEGFTSTTSNSVSVSVATGGSASASFGDQEQGTVSGKVFNDQNGNGLQDTGEPGIGGVTVQLLDEQGSVTAGATTVGDGSYRFDNVTAGSYTVKETDPSGYTSTTCNSVSVSVSGTGGATANFGDQEQGTVSGKVFKDVNGNGTKDTGEDGLGGVSVKLTQGGGTLETQTTSGDGSYTFSNVTAGSYVVEETDPSGYTSTTNNRVPINVSTTGGATANFGDQEAVSAWGRVFQDLNGNGLQDVGEQGIGGVTIKLLTAQGTVQQTTATSGDGSYRFTGIAYGSYQVEETDPSGYISTTNNAVPVSINASGSAIANFGDQREGTISGTVFNDTNGNGIQDPDEQGIGQVTVTLLKGSTELSNTTTAGNGSYSFLGLASDTYTVRETDPSGYMSTTDNSLNVTTGADSAVANFGDIADGTISGIVFNDTNGNGLQDPGENGVAGVTVNLLDSAEQSLQSVETTADGLYTFHHLASGTYIVEEVYPSGYTGTTTNRVTVTVGGVATANRTAEAVIAANFGVLQQESISGVVFNDLNGNGLQDPGEHGVGGVRITLVDGSGATVSTRDTAGDGTYSFYNVTPGNYAVRETYPTGYTGTTPQTVSITLASQGAATAIFGALQGDAPDHVTLTGPAAADLDQVSDAFTLNSRNNNDDISNVTANTVFALTSNSGTGVFYSDAAGTTAITQVTLADGTNRAGFYYKDATPGNPTVTATRTSGMSLGSATHNITITGKPASRVDLTGPATATAGAVSTAFTLTSLDADGDAADVTADTQFDLSSNSSGSKAFYSNAAGTLAITRVTILNGTSTATFYYKDGNAGTPTLTAAWNSGGTDLGSDTLPVTVSLAETTLATSTSIASAYKGFTVTITKVQMDNGAGTTPVTIFSGSSTLDLVKGGTFSGISDVSLPTGTYRRIRMTLKNSLPVTGMLRYGGKAYYTTGDAIGGTDNLAGDPSNDSGSQTVFIFRVGEWGALGADVTHTMDITPITVDVSTDYQPTLMFTISSKFLLKGIAGTVSTYYFELSPPVVSIVEP